MDYLPIFYSVKNKNILIVGAGKIALKRLETVLNFCKDVTIISPLTDEKIDILIVQNSLNYIKREYKKGDIEDFDIVIVAANDISLQKSIYKECKNKNILFNCVDILELNDFIFPAIIKEESLTMAFTTNGASASFTKRFKNYIKSKLPKNLGEFLNYLDEYRKTHPKGEKRMKNLKNMVDKYFEENFKD
ncbi:siroheme synthase [Halarcobacter ebronensis]|uniref:precorrin-2 dehydrogenase n=1 Tax=Halarcobacter ebronensis TaxID=1462615 RepID=A0A4Q0YJ56_9BACT|nr:bifunctional precorrin-2 dehydrogenase/sirohydrochlorin ferrochelatase [Halarcobacter ebronensis]RXJ68931.1 siroheme synthase [Halarcobacter ebronensis]